MWTQLLWKATSSSDFNGFSRDFLQLSLREELIAHPNPPQSLMVRDNMGMESPVEGDALSMAKKLSIVEGEKQKLQEKVDMLLKLWEIDKETLHNSLQDAKREHKLSTAHGAYELAKLDVAYGLLKQQELFAKQQSERSLHTLKSLQAKVKSLNKQLEDTVKDNEKLTEVLCSTKLKLEKQTFENNTLQSLLASANKELLRARTESLVPGRASSQDLLQQQELKAQNKEVAAPDSEALVMDPIMLDWLTSEVEAMHRNTQSANMELLEVKHALTDTEKLKTDLSMVRLQLEMIIREKEELQMQAALARNGKAEMLQEVLDCEKVAASIEGMFNRSAQDMGGLCLQKSTSLKEKLQIIERNVKNVKEAAGMAKVCERKVKEAESERSHAQKLLEDKEEELEYFTQQLELLREKNHMLRTQLNMEQLCKEAEMTTTSVVFPDRRDINNHNIRGTMELPIGNEESVMVTPSSRNARLDEWPAIENTSTEKRSQMRQKKHPTVASIETTKTKRTKRTSNSCTIGGSGTDPNLPPALIPMGSNKQTQKINQSLKGVNTRRLGGAATTPRSASRLPR